MAADLVEILAKIISFPSVSSSLPELNSCIDFCSDFLSARGMQIYHHNYNGVPSLFACTRTTKSPKILLQAHLDVVPASDDLYDLTMSEGKLYGRGVFDMKFAAAVFLKLVDDLQAELSQYDFGIMFTSDEEVGSQNGVGVLLNEGYGAEICILPDAGDNWHIETSQKGVWIIALSATGTAVHGSRPWEGDNAIERLISALQEIKQLFEDQHAKADTLSINKIFGGEAPNQVADWAEATLDIRFMSSSSHERLSQKIKALAVEHGVKMEELCCIHPFTTDLKHPLVRSFLDVAEEIKGETIGQIHSLGNSDAHFFAEHNIPAILMRPDGGAPHSEDEWLDRESFEKYYQAINSFIKKEARL